MGAVAWFARSALFGPLIARSVAHAINAHLDGHATIASADGGWMHDASLRSVDIASRPGAVPSWQIKTAVVAATYDLGLLRGHLSALRSVHISGLNASGDFPLVAAPSAEFPRWPGVIAQLPEMFPDISIDGDLAFQLGSHQVTAHGLSLTGSGDHVAVTVVALSVAGMPPQPLRVSLRRTALDSLALAEPLTVQLPVIGTITVTSMTLRLGPTGQEVSAVATLAGGDLTVHATPSQIDVRVRGVNLAGLALPQIPAGLSPVVVDAELRHQHQAAGSTIGGWLVRSMQVRSNDLDLALLKVPGLSGLVDATLDLSGALERPDAHLRLSSGVVHFDRFLGMADLSLDQDLRGLHVRSGALEIFGRGEGTFSGSLPFTCGLAGLTPVAGESANLRLELSGATMAQWLPDAAQRRIDGGGLTGRCEILGPAAALMGTGEFAFSGIRALPSTDATRTPVKPPVEIAATVRVDADRLGLSAVVDGSIADKKSLSAQLVAIATPDAPLWRDVRRWAVTALIELNDAQIADFSALAPKVRDLQGVIQGALEVSGTTGSPICSGSVQVREVEAKISADIPTITNGSAQMSLKGSVVTLDAFSAELGREALRGHGTVALNPQSPLTVDLTMSGLNLLLVQRHDARIRADLALRLQGPLDQLQLAGDVVVTNALLTPELSLTTSLKRDPSGPVIDSRVVLFEMVEPALSAMRFDLHITTAVPAAGGDGFRVVTRWGHATCEVDMRLGGTGAVPQPEGRVDVRAGVATLPFSTLQVSHAELIFAPGDPFQPRISASAATRIRRFDVQVQVDGPLLAPHVTASGTGLDEQDAMLLLTTGSTSSELQDEQGQRAAIGRLGGWLGQETWRNIDGESDPDAGRDISDRVSIEWGRNSTRQGRDTIESELELSPPGQWGAVLLTGERDRYDQYNAGLTLRLRWGGDEP